MAYHYSTSLPHVTASSVLPPRSRLSPPRLAVGKTVARPGLPEFLRELAFEELLDVDRRFNDQLTRPSLRIGLAATPWQLQQSLDLLQRQSLPSPLDHPGQSVADVTLDRVVALAMSTSLSSTCAGTLATIWLRRDGAAGLPADHWPGSQRALDQLRKAGRQLVAVEALAFDALAPSGLVLQPMLNVLKSIVENMWGATDIVLYCPRSQAAHYCGKLGFSRVPGQGHDVPHAGSILLRMPTQRVSQMTPAISAEALSA
ncbi:MAG: hypothetical protein JWL63_1262 [Rhodocyclales bacterium]|nr:hypothetical protein [Rhodocyclales bacterium]